MKSTLKPLFIALSFLTFLAVSETKAQIGDVSSGTTIPKACMYRYLGNEANPISDYGLFVYFNIPNLGGYSCIDCFLESIEQKCRGRYPSAQYYIGLCESEAQYYYFQVNGGLMKSKEKPKAMSAEEVAKLPGLSKFKPFRGNDDVQISVGTHTLIFHGNEGTANENPLDVCQSEGSQQCKSPNTWVVTKDEKAANGGFRIQPSNDKKAYLCFNGPDGGISVHRNPSSTDECIQWSIVPGQLGKDGEVTGYKIYPAKHPDYVLAVDTRSNQVRVDKVNTKADEAGEPDKAVLTNWTFTPGKSKRPVTHQEKVLQDADQK